MLLKTQKKMPIIIPHKGKLPLQILITILEIFLGKYSAMIILLIPNVYDAIPEKK
jgi:hypothetical protein